MCVWGWGGGGHVYSHSNLYIGTDVFASELKLGDENHHVRSALPASCMILVIVHDLFPLMHTDLSAPEGGEGALHWSCHPDPLSVATAGPLLLP